MLEEIRNPRQNAKEPRRRVFLSMRFDLFVWVAERGDVLAFELDYRDGARERALRWAAKSGYSHHVVDDGEDSPWKSRTPVLLRDGPFPRWSVLGRFRRAARGIDRALAEFVARKLLRYAPRAI